MRRSRPERSAGFTLLEVLIALVVFTTVMGGLLSAVSQGVRALGAAEREVALMELAQEQIRQIQSDAETGQAPELGEREGFFAEPYEQVRWQLVVEYFAYPLPERMSYAELAAARERSAIFADSVGQPTSLRLVVLRVFDESGFELLDPFTILTSDTEKSAGLRAP